MKSRLHPVTRLSLVLLAPLAPLPAVEEASLLSHAAATSDLRLQPDLERRAVAHAHLLTARMLEGESRMREALGHYLAFLQGSTGEPELVAHIAELALHYQGVGAAVKLLDDAIRAHPGDPGPMVNFTQFALTHGNAQNGLLARAAQLAETAAARFPTAAAVHENAVRLHLAQNGRDAAMAALERAAKQAVADPHYWLDLGRLALEVWPLADGEQREAHLAKVNPFYEKAAQHAQTAEDEDAELRVADFYLFSTQIGKAASLCETVVKRSGSLDARKRLVRLYEAQERPADSFQALEDLVKAFPADVEHRRLLATQHIQRGINAARASREDEAVSENLRAVEHLEAALQAGGGDLNDYLQISNLLRFSRQPERYEQFTARAQQLHPAEPRIHYQRAQALGQLKKYREAADAYGEAVRLAATRAPEILDDQFHFSWGIALERSGQHDAAAQQFQKSIDLTPAEDPQRAASVMNYLGYMWLEQNRQLDAAATLIRKANELEPDNAAFVDSLGWLHFKQGRYQEALTELQRSEALLRREQPEPEPGDAEIYDHIAQTLDKLGQHDKALEYWKRILELKPEVEAIRQRAEKALGPRPPATQGDTKTK